MQTENAHTDTDVQQKRKVGRGKTRPFLMSKRPAKGPTDQRKITLPGHVWELLDRVAQLQSKAYALMAGKTKFQVSDLLESGAEMYLRSLMKDVGPFPKTAAEEADYVKRLAEVNKRALLEDLLGKSDDTH